MTKMVAKIRLLFNLLYLQIIIYHPHGGVVGGRAQQSQAHSEVSELNLSQAVIALAAGPLRPDSTRDMLLIGSPTQILGNRFCSLLICLQTLRVIQSTSMIYFY